MRVKTLAGTAALASVLAIPAVAAGQTYPTPPTYPQPAPLKFTSKLELARASTVGGFLDVLLPITSRASGRVNVEYFAAGARTRFTVAINSTDGRVRFRRRLPSAQARLGTGILTVSYAGDADTRPQTIRLRAAANQAQLDLARPRIVNGRVQASGTISTAARGIVRLAIEYQLFGATRTANFRATISNGRWRIDAPLSQQDQSGIALRTGTVHSYTQFTGYLQRRVRGEQLSFQVLGDR